MGFLAAPTPGAPSLSMAAMETLGITDLSPDLLLEVVRYCGHRELCALGASCSRLRPLCFDEANWERLHTQRWRHREHAAAPAHGWRSDYARRHAQDAQVGPLLFEVALKRGGSPCDAPLF